VRGDQLDQAALHQISQGHRLEDADQHAEPGTA
jgi:hypothetical protein